MLHRILKKTDVIISSILETNNKIQQSTAVEQEIKQLMAGQDKSMIRPDTLNITFKDMTSHFGSIRAGCVGYDGNFYAVYENKPIRKITDVTDGTAMEEGVVFDGAAYGNPSQIAVFEDGIVICAGDTNGNAYILHYNNMTDANPTVAYQTQGAYFPQDFGFDALPTNGTGLVLAGEYGHNNSQKNLVLSIDGGRTFTVVRKTDLNSGNINSHYHDVSIDFYNGILWASQGDQGVSKILYSMDMGGTWKQLTTDIPRQPTKIFPFPDRIVFGRDWMGLPPGFDYFDVPTTKAGWENVKSSDVKILKEFYLDELASQLYITGGKARGLEAYASVLNVMNNVGDKPNQLFGTLDGGRSIHGLGIFTDVGTTAYFMGIYDFDDKYLYGRIGHKICYAEKPKFRQ